MRSVCHREKESSWFERKDKEGLKHPRITFSLVILSLIMVLHLSDTWGSSALTGKCHMAETVAKLPEEQMLLTEKVIFSG